MANCDNYVFWSPVPAGSTFNVKASGDKDVFNVVVGRTCNGQTLSPWQHADVEPGPAKQIVGVSAACTFTPVVAVFAVPTNPVTLEAWISDVNGNDVSVTGTGGTVTLRCSWQFATKGAFLIDIDMAS